MANKDMLEVEKQKRKELSRVRVFWLLVVLSILLIILIAVQFVILANN